MQHFLLQLIQLKHFQSHSLARSHDMMPTYIHARALISLTHLHMQYPLMISAVENLLAARDIFDDKSLFVNRSLRNERGLLIKSLAHS